jgi:hypothetical protein
VHAAGKTETLGAVEYPAKPFDCNGLLVTGQDRVFRCGVNHLVFTLKPFRLKPFAYTDLIGCNPKRFSRRKVKKLSEFVVGSDKILILLVLATAMGRRDAISLGFLGHLL